MCRFEDLHFYLKSGTTADYFMTLLYLYFGRAKFIPNEGIMSSMHAVIMKLLKGILLF